MKKLLLVNSISSSREREKTLLNRADLTILTATSVKEALQIHRQEKVDLIVSELEMPEMGGDILCSLLRRENGIRKVAVLLICSDTDEHMARVSRCGANSFVTKPFSPEVLLERAGQLLDIASRKGYRVLLRVRVRGERETSSFFCTSHNISASGMLIETETYLEAGCRITCSFFLPGSRQIIVDGDVVRAQAMDERVHHYGVKFVDLAPESRGEIEKFILSTR